MRTGAFKLIQDSNNPENYLQNELYELVKNDSSIFDFVQETSLDGIWFWDLENPDNEWMSPKFWNTLGYDYDEIPHRASFWQSIIDQEDLKDSQEILKRHINDPSQPYDHTVRYKHKLGHTVYIRCRGFAIRDDNDKATRMLGAHIDVTKLRKTKELLKKQNERYKQLIEGTNLGTWEWNILTGETIFNERWAETIGYSLIEITPVSIETWMQSLHYDDVRIFNAALIEHVEGKKEFFECEVRMKHKNGSWVWVLNKGKVITRSSSGDAEIIIGTHEEITKRKEQEELQKVFIEHAPSAIAMLNKDMRYIAHSKKWLSDYNLKGTSLIGKSHYEVFPEISGEWKQLHQRCLSGEVLTSDNDCFVRADGSRQWISWEIHPWYRSPGQIGGMIMLTTDRTKEKEAELKTRLSEKKFKESFTNAAMGMAIVGLDGAWIEVNDSLCNILGYNEVELRTRTFQNLTHHEDIQADLKAINNLLEGKISFYHVEKRYMHKTGRIVYAFVSVSLIRDEEDKPLYFVTHIKDITQRVTAKRELESTVQKLAGIFDASSEVSIIATDTDGVVTDFNKGAENLLGYTKDELIGKETPALIHDKDEVNRRGDELSEELDEYIEGFDVFVAMAKRGQPETREWTYIKKDGTRFPVQLTFTAIKEDGVIVGYLGVATNISEIKNIQNEINQLLEVTKNQNTRLKNFAHIVSHNLRSHAVNFSMLMDLYNIDDTKEQLQEHYKQLMSAAYNLKETVDYLSEVVIINTSEEHEMVSLPLKKYIDKNAEGISGIAKKANVRIENLVSPEVNVMGVAAYLDSVILNFLTNGIRYRSEERDSFIRLSSYQEKGFTVLTIEDNGLGIDLKKHRSKIFGMYKTFHRHEDSRGLGLFMTKNQIEAMNGKVDVKSEVNKGTIFKVYLKNE